MLVRHELRAPKIDRGILPVDRYYDDSGIVKRSVFYQLLYPDDPIGMLLVPRTPDWPDYPEASVPHVLIIHEHWYRVFSTYLVNGVLHGEVVLARIVRLPDDSGIDVEWKVLESGTPEPLTNEDSLFRDKTLFSRELIQRWMSFDPTYDPDVQYLFGNALAHESIYNRYRGMR